MNDPDHVQMTGDPLDPLGLFEMAGPTLSEDEKEAPAKGQRPSPTPQSASLAGEGDAKDTEGPGMTVDQALDRALYFKGEMWEARHEVARRRAELTKCLLTNGLLLSALEDIAKHEAEGDWFAANIIQIARDALVAAHDREEDD